jgi:hypothetical protein
MTNYSIHRCSSHYSKKIKYLNWLYKDWLDYKKYYKSIGFPMQETFIEYLQREIEIEGVEKNG